MNAFQLARRYPNAENEADAINALHSEISDIDLQIDTIRAKRDTLVCLIGKGAPHTTPSKDTNRNASEVANNHHTGPLLGNRTHRQRENGVIEYLYKNEPYSRLSKLAGIGTHGGKHEVWLSSKEAKAMHAARNREDARRAILTGK